MLVCTGLFTGGKFENIHVLHSLDLGSSRETGCRESLCGCDLDLMQLEEDGKIREEEEEVDVLSTFIPRYSVASDWEIGVLLEEREARRLEMLLVREARTDFNLDIFHANEGLESGDGSPVVQIVSKIEAPDDDDLTVVLVDEQGEHVQDEGLGLLLSPDDIPSHRVLRARHCQVCKGTCCTGKESVHK